MLTRWINSNSSNNNIGFSAGREGALTRIVVGLEAGRTRRALPGILSDFECGHECGPGQADLLTTYDERANVSERLWNLVLKEAR
jgi:hypothetical protein